jgi:hypothetical protein
VRKIIWWLVVVGDFRNRAALTVLCCSGIIVVTLHTAPHSQNPSSRSISTRCLSCACDVQYTVDRDGGRKISYRFIMRAPVQCTVLHYIIAQCYTRAL